MKYQVFMSYRRDGADILAQSITYRLREKGYSVFFDMESMRSGKFNEQIYQVISECTHVIVVLPPNGLDRCVNEGDWLRNEIAYAIANKKTIIPVLMKGFTFPTDLPDDIKEIRDYQGVSPSTEFFDATIDRLISYLSIHAQAITNTIFNEKQFLHWVYFGFKLGRMEFIWGVDLPKVKEAFEPSKKELDNLICAEHIVLDETNYRSYCDSIINHFMYNNAEVYSAILIGICIQRAGLIRVDESMRELSRAALFGIPIKIVPDQDELFEIIVRNKDKAIIEISNIIYEFISSINK